MDKTIQTKNVEVMNFLNDGKIATQDNGRILNIINKTTGSIVNSLRTETISNPASPYTNSVF